MSLKCKQRCIQNGKVVQKKNMNKTIKTILLSIAFLATTSVVEHAASFLPWSFWLNFGIASGLLLVGIVLLCVFRKKVVVKYIVVAVNAFAMGLFLRCWYIDRGFSNSLWLMLLVSLAAVVYLLLFLAVRFLLKNKTFAIVLYIVVSLIVYVLLVCLTKTTWVSTLGFFGLIQMGFAVGLCMSDECSELTICLCSTYSVIICAAIVLFVALGADCADIFDGLDIDLSSSSSKDKKNK